MNTYSLNEHGRIKMNAAATVKAQWEKILWSTTIKSG